MDDYEKVKKIGEGSFSTAWLVHDRRTGTRFVLKEVNILRMTAQEKAEALKEAYVLSKLRHPNIVSYKDSFERNGFLNIVTDYCDGGDLHSKIFAHKERREDSTVHFSQITVLSWFLQLCLALQYTHERKILHRDIKAKNIFLTKSGVVKLGDFGIARILDRSSEMAWTCVGTPYYLSPEMCEGKPYNSKSDVWALGCVLYEMCALRHAFQADNFQGLVIKIVSGCHGPVPTFYSHELRSLIREMLRKRPDDRPSINALLQKPFLVKLLKKAANAQIKGVQNSFRVVPKPAHLPVDTNGNVTTAMSKYGSSVAVRHSRCPKLNYQKLAHRKTFFAREKADQYSATSKVDAQSNTSSCFVYSPIKLPESSTRPETKLCYFPNVMCLLDINLVSPLVFSTMFDKGSIEEVVKNCMRKQNLIERKLAMRNLKLRLHSDESNAAVTNSKLCQQRTKWNLPANCQKIARLPLEATASQMEDTSTNDAVVLHENIRYRELLKKIVHENLQRSCENSNAVVSLDVAPEGLNEYISEVTSYKGDCKSNALDSTKSLALTWVAPSKNKADVESAQTFTKHDVHIQICTEALPEITSEDGCSSLESTGERIFNELESLRERTEKMLGLEKFLRAYREVQRSQDLKELGICDMIKNVESILGPEQSHLTAKVLQIAMSDSIYLHDMFVHDS